MKKIGDKIARIVTRAMATWTFIAIILITCTSEIYGNAHGLFHFDPTMLVLNTVLSLWAAVQGSIIMINQNQQDEALRNADDKRDEMLVSILQIQNDISQHITGEESTLAEINRKIDTILERLEKEGK
jgi:uncharacterized membrane protein